MIELARRRMMGGNPLPYDAAVEYIESTGSQYINTGILTQTSLRLILDGVFRQSREGDHGSILPNKRFHVGMYIGKFFFGIGNQTWSVASHNANRHTFELNGNGYAKFDSTQRFLAAVANNSNYVYLFARNGNGTASIFVYGFRLYGAKMYVGDELVRDFIPVRIGSVGYLYDKVNEQFYGRQGSGAFIVGPDK